MATSLFNALSSYVEYFMTVAERWLAAYPTKYSDALMDALVASTHHDLFAGMQPRTVHILQAEIERVKSWGNARFPEPARRELFHQKLGELDEAGFLRP